MFEIDQRAGGVELRGEAGANPSVSPLAASQGCLRHPPRKAWTQQNITTNNGQDSPEQVFRLTRVYADAFLSDQLLIVSLSE